MTAVDLFGLDAVSEVSPAAQHQVGSKVMIRYLSRYTAKVITRAEFAAYQADGIYLGLVFEDSATNALLGYDQGRADAEFAIKQATDILGAPANPGAMIPGAVDYDPTGQEAKTDPYFDGWAAVLTHARSGPYGSYSMAAHAYGRGFRGIFQTYAWSAGQFFQPSKWFQYSNDHTVGGVGVDYDKVFDLGSLWNWKPAPADPHHYLDFYEGPFAWGKYKGMNERAIVERYDVLRAKQTKLRHPDRAELATLRAQCRALADRIAFVASKGNVVSGVAPQVWAGNWTAFHRKERYRGLIARSQGERVA